MVFSGTNRFRCVALCASLLVLVLSVPVFASEVSFRNDVMAIISKAGCNAGTCHGNANGKAGFKLSLRGEDAESDFQVLTRDMFARRTNPMEPDQSLILLKATAQLAHEGGLRFRKDSPEYNILRDWIAGGCTNDITTAPRLTMLEVYPTEVIAFEPTNTLQLSVRARFSDGRKCDATWPAVYDSPKQP